MPGKPDCLCWKDPEMAARRELEVDGLRQAFMASVDQATRDLNMCGMACPYVAGAVVAGMVFWVAYMLRGDGQAPTGEQLSLAEQEIITLSRNRLKGVRTITDALH